MFTVDPALDTKNAAAPATTNRAAARRIWARRLSLGTDVRGPIHVADDAAILHVHVDPQSRMTLQDVVERDRGLGRADLVAERGWQDDRVAALALVARRHDGRPRREHVEQDGDGPAVHERHVGG